MKALFLDIDGVIQSPSDQKRFEHVNEFVELSKRLTRDLNNGFDYFKYGGNHEGDNCRMPAAQYDIAAVYYDWRPEIVDRLRQILESTDAKIVLSSDWREKGLDNMRGLLDIHGLGKYLYPSAPFCVAYWAPYMQALYSEEVLIKMDQDTKEIMNQLSDLMYRFYQGADEGSYVDVRSAEIREFLDRHQEITAYVVIDDRNLIRGNEGHFIKTYPLISQQQAESAIEILNREDGPYPLPPELKPDGFEQWRSKWVYGNKFLP